MEEFNWGSPIPISLFTESSPQNTGTLSNNQQYAVASRASRQLGASTDISPFNSSKYDSSSNPTTASEDEAHSQHIYSNAATTANNANHLLSEYKSFPVASMVERVGYMQTRRIPLPQIKIRKPSDEGEGQEQIKGIEKSQTEQAKKKKEGQMTSDQCELLVEGTKHTLEMKKILSKSYAHHIGLVHCVMSICSELFDMIDTACGSMNYEIGALEIILENQGRRLNMSRGAKNNLNEMIAEQNRYLALMDKVEELSDKKAEHCRQLSGQMMENLKLLGNVQGLLEEATSRHEAAMERKMREPAYTYDTAVMMSYLYRLRASTEPFFLLFPNCRPLVHKISTFNARARRIELAVSSEIRPMPLEAFKRQMATPEGPCRPTTCFIHSIRRPKSINSSKTPNKNMLTAPMQQQQTQMIDQ